MAFRRVTIRPCRSANSGPRWLIIWRESSDSVSGGHGVGPGMRRFCTVVSLPGITGIVAEAPSQRQGPNGPYEGAVDADIGRGMPRTARQGALVALGSAKPLD